MKEGFLQQNEEASAKYCQTKLDQISKTLKKSISAGSFSVPGGHKLYKKAMGRLQVWLFPCAQERSEGEEQGEHGEPTE